jgi:hypothetical protein
MAVATRATRRLDQRRNPPGRGMGLEIRRGITGQATRPPSRETLPVELTIIGRDKPRIKAIGTAPTRRLVRAKEIHRVVRTAGVQTLEQQMAVQGGARLERRRAGISMEMATSIEGMDSRVGDGQIRQRLPRVPLPETRRPGRQRGIRLQTGPRRIIRRLVRRHSLRAARSSNLNLAVRSVARAILARIARRAIAGEQAWERHSSHKAAVIAVELRGARGNAK